MNEYLMRRRLMDDGYTWEEAETIVGRYAEDEMDDRREREMDEEFFNNQGESK